MFNKTKKENQMKSKIIVRIAKRKKDLEILKSALEVLKVQERTYAHIDGRIREIENELDFLEELRKSSL